VLVGGSLVNMKPAEGSSVNSKSVEGSWEILKVLEGSLCWCVQLMLDIRLYGMERGFW
jgi:hypothetical protein